MAKRGQNEGSIYQRNDERWCATINLGRVNGKRLRKSYYGETRKEVQEQLTTALSDVQKGLPVLLSKQTVGGHLAWWLEEVVKRNCRPATYTSYEYLVRIHIAPALGEALALRWQDLNLETGKLRVRYALQRFNPRKTGDIEAEPKPPTELHLVEPKTKKSRRTIDLPQVTRSALAAHRMRQDEERSLVGSARKVPMVHCEGRLEPIDDFVFTTAIGTPLESRNVTKRFQKILKGAKIPRHRYHDLRHTAATLLAVQGVHPKTIQSVLGWDQAAMMDRYGHFVDEMRKAAADGMDAILNPVAVRVAVKQPERKAN